MPDLSTLRFATFFPKEQPVTGSASGLNINHCFSGAPLEGYHVAIRDVRRTMWIQVGMVGADVTRLQIKELHVSPCPCSQTDRGARSSD